MNSKAAFWIFLSSLILCVYFFVVTSHHYTEAVDPADWAAVHVLGTITGALALVSFIFACVFGSLRRQEDA